MKNIQKYCLQICRKFSNTVFRLPQLLIIFFSTFSKFLILLISKIKNKTAFLNLKI